MIHPPGLEPTTTERFLLSDGQFVYVPKATPAFAAWQGRAPGNTFGGKTLVCHQDRPAFAELAILWRFIEVGWQGAWIDSFGSRRLRDFWPEPVPQGIPEEQEALLQSLCGAGTKPWDVYCWSPPGVIFVEAKRQKRDSIRPTQVAFLERGLGAGLGLDAFLIVEWTVA